MQAWTARVAPVVKSYAPKQLVTVGQDGFWQADNCASDTCAPSSWPISQLRLNSSMSMNSFNRKWMAA